VIVQAIVLVSGGYRGAGCGSIGAFAERNEGQITLTVGTNRSSPCDAILQTYNYSAKLINIQRGSYSMRVFHRRNGGEEAEAAASMTIIVP